MLWASNDWKCMRQIRLRLGTPPGWASYIAFVLLKASQLLRPIALSAIIRTLLKAVHSRVSGLNDDLAYNGPFDFTLCLWHQDGNTRRPRIQVGREKENGSVTPLSLFSWPVTPTKVHKRRLSFPLRALSPLSDPSGNNLDTTTLLCTLYL
ncbi:hypothetical protein BCR34DRAFT_42348 [Clohesyomyces aquaticus]|uniref:Uncharacterized protein n=1 Tax=Clohesyomyces aquaticus TaxID=1231657 RepID=A0A1Y1Z6P1_9PLEO|nr:hypothetical protein BCR34DRAFT_42348 [Clohesyomyces aquaticus]